jgi:hypothetical protein
VAAVLVTLATAQAAAASDLSIQTTVNPVGARSSQLAGVSCGSATHCIAVGSYANSTGTELTLAEVWNGTDWSIQPTPSPSGAKRSQLAAVSCASDTGCIAVGNYTDSAGSERTLAETWNGAAWTTDPTPNPAGAKRSQLTAVSCPSASSCTAVGDFTNSRGTELTLAEDRSGTTWTTKATPNPAGAKSSQLDALSCTSASSCAAVGHYTNSSGTELTLAEERSATAWTTKTTPKPAGAKSSQLAAVSCTSSASCVAVGYYTNAGGTVLTMADLWKGTTWKTKPAPSKTGAKSSQLAAVSCALATACTAVGNYTNSSGTDLTLAEVWNGTAWTIEGSASPAGAKRSQLAGVACNSTTACTAVGSQTDSSGTTLTLGEGLQPGWAVQTTRNPVGNTNSQLAGVSCPDLTTCIAVGLTQTSAGYRAMAERRDGTTWSLLTTLSPSGATTSALNSVSCTSSSACTAVGYSIDGAGTIAPLAERWNGTAWSIQSTPYPTGARNTQLYSVSCTSPTVCVAVGGFGTGIPAGSLAEVWNGAAWSIESTPNPGGSFAADLTGVSCRSTSACTAVGFWADGAGNVTTLAETLEGTTWTLRDTPALAGSGRSQLLAVSCIVATDCTAVGYSVINSGATYVTVAERWNGTSWTQEASPNPPGAKDTQFQGVSCTSATACIAVGFSASSKPGIGLAEVWNGAGWALDDLAKPAGSKGTSAQAVSCTSATVCTAIGSYSNQSNLLVTLAERSS